MKRRTLLTLAAGIPAVLLSGCVIPPDDFGPGPGPKSRPEGPGYRGNPGNPGNPNNRSVNGPNNPGNHYGNQPGSPANRPNNGTPGSAPKAPAGPQPGNRNAPQGQKGPYRQDGPGDPNPNH